MAYKIYGTNQSYSGMVVGLGSRLYTTVGGALEGDSKEVIEVKAGTGNYQQWVVELVLQV